MRAPRNSELISTAPMLELVRRAGLTRFTLADLRALLAQSLATDLIPAHLASLGENTQADRVYVFLNHLDAADGSMLCSHIYEWCAPGISPQIDNPLLQEIRLSTVPEWHLALEQGKAVSGLVEGFSENVRRLMESQEILNVLVVPIRADGIFWGWLGLDSVRAVRQWTPREEGLLWVVAAGLGARIAQAILGRRLTTVDNVFEGFTSVLPMGAIVVDGEGRILYRNKAFLRVYGWDETEVRSLEDWRERAYSPEARAQILGDMEAGMRVLEPHELTYSSPREYPIRCKDGTLRPVEVHVISMGSQRAIVLLDMTDRNNLEWMQLQALKQKRAQRQQQVASMERMAGSIAHVFNNQLGVLLGALEMLKAGLPADSPALGRIQVAMDAAARAANVSTSALAYLGKIQAKAERVELAALCRDSVQHYMESYENPPAIRLSLPAAEVWVQADSQPLQRILLVLLQHAQEAMFSGDIAMTLSVKAAADFDETAGYLLPVDWAPPANGYLQLSVADNGLGIPENMLIRSFEPFMDTQYQPQGVGLPEARGYMRAWNGAIGVESETGLGSTFSLYFPVCAPPAAEAPPEGAAP